MVTVSYRVLERGYAIRDLLDALQGYAIQRYTVVYQVMVANGATGFHWEGQVDAAGRVTEKVAPK